MPRLARRYPSGPLQRQLQQVLSDGVPMRRKDIAEQLDRPSGSLSGSLTSATRAGRIVRRSHGVYQLGRLPNVRDVPRFSDERFGVALEQVLIATDQSFRRVGRQAGFSAGYCSRTFFWSSAYDA